MESTDTRNYLFTRVSTTWLALCRLLRNSQRTTSACRHILQQITSESYEKCRKYAKNV